MSRGILLAVFPILMAASPLSAQDTTIIKPVPGGFMIDFVNQPIRTVIDALVDAGGFGYTVGRIPNNLNGTLKVGPITRAEIPQVLKSFIEAQGLRLTVNADSTFYSIDPAPPANQQGRNTQAAAVSPTEMGVYTLQLRHQSNIELAQLLAQVFSTTGRGGAAIINNQAARGNQAGRANQAGRGGAAGGGGGGRGGGRGGGGGGDDNNDNNNNDPQTTASNLSSLNPSAAMASLMPLYSQADIADRMMLQQQPAQDRIQAVLQQGGAAAAGLAQILGPQAVAVQQALQGAAAGQQATQPVFAAMPGTNQLIIRATQADFDLIQALVNAVDLRPLQVLIEVSIIEVRRTNDLDFGIAADGSFTKRGDTDPRATATLAAPASFDTARDFVLQLAGGRGTVDFNVALHALATRGDVKVHSLPIILAQNNLQAQLIVGEQRPFVSTTQVTDVGSVSSIVQYRDVSTTLIIVPTINGDGYVNMDVNQQVQDVTNEVQFDAPIISTRQAITSVFVKSGQTAVIGGLASNRLDKTRTGIPFLSRIPIIGALFGATRNSDVVTELYLFLTPHVVETDLDTDYIREAVKNQSPELFRNVPLRQIITIPQPDTTIRVIIPPDTGRTTTIPRVDSAGRRIPPPAGTVPPPAGTIPPDGKGRAPSPTAMLKSDDFSYMGMLSR